MHVPAASGLHLAFVRNFSAALARAVRVPVIASGGVGSLADVSNACGRGLAGLIVGRALYTGAVELARALEVAACS